jgi:hypothetical protein
VKDTLGTQASDEHVRETVLQMLKPLLEQGKLRAVDLVAGGSFAEWPGTPAEQRTRIDSEWRALGRDVDIGDIVWFVGPGRTTW